jgi:hypothetical protein
MAAAAAAAATLSTAAGMKPPAAAAASAMSRAATPAPSTGGPSPTKATTPGGTPAAAAASPAGEGGDTPAGEQPSPNADTQQQQQQQQQQPATEPPQTPSKAAAAAEAAAAAVRASEAAAAESARRQARAEAIKRLEELNVPRLEPLGLDRRSNRYWLLVPPDFSLTSAYTGAPDDLVNNIGSIEGVCVCRSCGFVVRAAPLSHQPWAGAGTVPPVWTPHPTCLRLTHTHKHTTAGMPPDANVGRIWVESADTGRWRLLLKRQQLDQLLQVLEPRGIREGALQAALLRVEGAVRAAMPAQPLSMPPSLGEAGALAGACCLVAVRRTGTVSSGAVCDTQVTSLSPCLQMSCRQMPARLPCLLPAAGCSSSSCSRAA